MSITHPQRAVDNSDLEVLKEIASGENITLPDNLTLASPWTDFAHAGDFEELEMAAIVLGLVEAYQVDAPEDAQITPESLFDLGAEQEDENALTSQSSLRRHSTVGDLLRTMKNWPPEVTGQDMALFTNILSKEITAESPPPLNQDTPMSSLNLGDLEWPCVAASLEEAYGVTIIVSRRIKVDSSTVGDLIRFIKGFGKDPDSPVTMVGHISYTSTQVLNAVTDEITAKVGPRAAEQGGDYDRGETLDSIGLPRARRSRLHSLIDNLEERFGILHRIARQQINSNTAIGGLAETVAQVLASQGRMRT